MRCGGHVHAGSTAFLTSYLSLLPACWSFYPRVPTGVSYWSYSLMHTVGALLQVPLHCNVISIRSAFPLRSQGSGTRGSETQPSGMDGCRHPAPNCFFGRTSCSENFCQIWGTFLGRLCQFPSNTHPDNTYHENHSSAVKTNSILQTICWFHSFFFFHIKKSNLAQFDISCRNVAC